MRRKCVRRASDLGLLKLVVLSLITLGNFTVFPSLKCIAGWNGLTGIKDGSDTVIEPSANWSGHRLIALGGSLNFAGEVDLTGDLWLQQMNGWGNPVVSITGALIMDAPTSLFRIEEGTTLSLGNAAGSSIEVGTARVASSLTVGTFTAHGAVEAVRPTTTLHVLDDYLQHGGDFSVIQSGKVQIDGTFTKTGSGQFQVHGANSFSLTNQAASSIEAGVIDVAYDADVTVGNVVAHGNVTIATSGTSLHVLDNFEQDGGNFVVHQNSAFDVDGRFVKTGNGRFEVSSGGTTFAIGDPQASSIEAGDVRIADAQQLAIGSMLTHGNVLLEHTNTKLHVLGDYVQDSGNFNLAYTANMVVDGKFTKTGNGEFRYGLAETSLVIGNAAASSIEAGDFYVSGSSELTIGNVVVHGNAAIIETGTLLHVLGDYQQNGGGFDLAYTASMVVDGKFTKTGNGDFRYGLANTSLEIGNAAASSIEAGDFYVTGGSELTIGNVVVHGNAEVKETGTLLHVLGDYQQDGGSFNLAYTANMVVDGKFIKTGNGEFRYGLANASLVIGNAAASSIEAGGFYVNSGGDLTIGSVTVHDSAEIHDPGTTLHVLGDYVQDGGSFRATNAVAIDIDGKFTKSGNGEFVVYNVGLSPDNAAASHVEAGIVSLAFNSEVTLGNLTAHANAQIDNGAKLHLLGDYSQDAGDFRVSHTNTAIQIGGKFTKSGNGEFVVYDIELSPGNAAESHVEAGIVSIAFNSELTLGNLTAHSNVQVDNGSKLHLLGNYFQDGGHFKSFHSNTVVTIDGSFTQTGSEGVELYNLTFTSGDMDVPTLRVDAAANSTVGDLTIHGFFTVINNNTKLQVLGDFQQDGGNLSVNLGGTMTVAGAFSYAAGNLLEVRNNSVLTTGNLTGGTSIANHVLVDTGGQATIGHLTAHGNVIVNHASSVLRVGGDYYQDVGGLTIGNNATLNVEGSFKHAVPGTKFLDFGNGLLRVGKTLTIEKGHYWNLPASGGRIRVGDGLTAPAAGTLHIAANGTLRGEGTIIGSVTNAAGTVAPGISVGRFDIVGDYAQAVSGQMLIEVGGTVSDLEYDKLYVSGAATLAGTLKVNFVDLGSGVFVPTLGQTFEILNSLGGVTGMFTQLELPNLASGLDWNVTYLPDAVTLSVVAGAVHSADFDGDGDVDGADFVLWQTNFPAGIGQSPSTGDSDFDGDVDGADFAVWQANFPFGSGPSNTPVPEPSSVVLAFVFVAMLVLRRYHGRFCTIGW